MRDSLTAKRQRDCEHEQPSQRDLLRLCGSNLDDNGGSSYNRFSRRIRHWRVLGYNITRSTRD